MEIDYDYLRTGTVWIAVKYQGVGVGSPIRSHSIPIVLLVCFCLEP